MAHFFSEGGFTVLQLFSYRLQIIDRNRNPIMSSSELPIYQQKEFRIWKYGINISRFK